MVLAIDLPNEDVVKIARQCAKLEADFPNIAMLLVTTCSKFQAIRDLGLLHEYLIPHDDWVRTGEPHSWTGYVLRRLKLLASEYGPSNVVVAGDLLVDQGIDHNLYGTLLALAPQLASGGDATVANSVQESPSAGREVAVSSQ